MDIISLGLNRRDKPIDDQSGAADLIEQLQMLMRGIGLHAIESQPTDLENLQRGLGETAHGLASDSSPDALMAAISGTLRLIGDYNRAAAVIFEGQIEELREMLSTMTETIQFIVSSSEMSVKQLAFLEAQLQRASGLEDLRQLKTYTTSCLTLVRRESARLQRETRARMEGLNNDVARLSIRLKEAAVEGSRDALTGLPGRAAAEQAIEKKIAAGKTFAAALFLMDRLAAINGRLGNRLGDEMFLGCAQMLARDLSGATLYRWSGPGFLGIFDPTVTISDAESRANHAAAQKLEKNLATEQWELLVVIGLSCQIQAITGKTIAGDLFRKMDGFMVAATG